MAEESKTLIQKLQEAQAAQSDLAAKLTASETKCADLTKQLEGVTAEAAKLKADNETLTAKAAIDSQEIDKMKAALANPAFAAAAITGTSGKGSDAGNEAASEQPLTQAEARSQYAKLEGAQARADFRKKNWKALGIEEEK